MKGLKPYTPWSVVAVITAILSWGCTVQVDYANAKAIVVGGEQGWRFGYNYTDWISKAGKIYVNDTLVFKYHIPQPNEFPHTVVLLKHKKNYQACIFNNGTKLAGPTNGTGEGFAFKLKKVVNYYFVCDVHNGIHCDRGLMKFAVKPVVKTEF